MFDSLQTSLYESLRPILPLPLWQKLVALLLTVVCIAAAYFYLGWMPIQQEIEAQQGALKAQQIKLQRNQRLAHDLPRKQKEYADLERQLVVALDMLPKMSQIPDLLDSVSWAGKDSGLVFKNFKPGRETTRQIYAEVPVDLDVSGSYRQLLTFLKRVGEMSRIVDVKNLKLTQKKDDSLNVTGKVVTYRFVEEQGKGRRRASGKPGQ